MALDIAWYRLSRVTGLGPKRLHAIFRALTSAGLTVEDIFVLPEGEFRRLLPALAGAFFPRIQAAGDGDMAGYVAMRERGVVLVHLGHEAYPSPLLQRLGDSAPPILYCDGSLAILGQPGIAIVGSRRASEPSLAFAADLALQAASAGVDVISGYAGGVDSAAHLGSLRAGGTTTMVLSSGILEFAPRREFVPLLQVDNALAVSQFSPQERWSARNAMVRNSLVAGLAQALVVVEAGAERDERGRMSGTFDAGRSALRMGTPTFVLDPAIVTEAAPGNAALIALGGIAVGFDVAVGQLLAHAESQPEREGKPVNLPLF